MESITGRIKNIITERQLSPAKFADEIEVQRSSISHILSERNKPSLEIVQKILKRFPETDVYWLLNGKPGPVHQEIKKTVENQELNTPNKDLPHDITNVTPAPPLSPKTEGTKIEESSQKEIEKIIIMYSDKTFSVHFSEK